MGFSNRNPATLNLKLVTFCTALIFNMPYVQPLPQECFSANGNFQNRYGFMCFTVKISHNPGIANVRPATKNSGVRSAILSSASLKISLLPKIFYVVSFLHSSLTWTLFNLTFLTGFIDMLCVSFLNIFADLSLIHFQCLKAPIHRLISCIRMTSQLLGELQISVPTTDTYKIGKSS